MDAPDFFAAAQDYGFTDLSNETLLRALQGSVDSIERLRPWPFLETSATLTWVGGTARPTTPPERVRAVLSMSTYTTRKKLQPVRLDDFEELVRADYYRDGAAQVYYIMAGEVLVWPRPPAGTSMEIVYLQYSARLTETSVEADFLIPARHHEVVFFGMLRRLYDQQDDPELAATMAQQRDQGVMDMVEDLMKQQYDQPDIVRLTDPNDWF